MKFTYAVGATPIDADEAAGLIPSHIATQSDLNTWEEANILQGVAWAQRQKKRELLKEEFVRELHKQMFNRTWRWAGTFRASNKNIGVDWAQYWQVVLRGLQILADRQHLNVMRAHVAHHLKDFVVGLAQAKHQPRFGRCAWVAFFKLL